MGGKLAELARVTEIAYRADLARLHAISDEEAGLRADIAHLVDEIARADAQDALEAMPLRNIGGDVLWRGWAGRKRAHLNMRLAMVLARKQQALEVLKRSFGKKSAVEDLLKREQSQLRQQRARRQLQIDQAQMIEAAVRTAAPGKFPA